MASRIDLARDVFAEILRIARERLADALAVSRNPRLAIEDRIHKARTSCKRCRAALKLVRAAAPRRFRRENQAIARAARKLSGFRDADAAVECLGAVLGHYRATHLRSPFIRAGRLQVLRTTKRNSAKAERQLESFASRIHAISKRLESWSLEVDFPSAAAGFSRSYRRARRAFRLIEGNASSTRFHEWRKSAKDCFYQCRMLRAAWPAIMKALGRELKELTHALGDEHDLAILHANIVQGKRANHRGGTDSTAAVLELIATRREELHIEALHLGMRLFGEKPKAIESRLVHWWLAAKVEATAEKIE